MKTAHHHDNMVISIAPFLIDLPGRFFAYSDLIFLFGKDANVEELYKILNLEMEYEKFIAVYDKLCDMRYTALVIDKRGNRLFYKHTSSVIPQYKMTSPNTHPRYDVELVE